MPKKIIKKIKWAQEALADVERLQIFLNDKDAPAAARAAIKIIEGGRSIQSFPFIGRPMPDDTGQRELPVTFGSGTYVLRYRLDDDETPVIIRVWHSRENRNN